MSFFKILSGVGAFAFLLMMVVAVFPAVSYVSSSLNQYFVPQDVLAHNDSNSSTTQEDADDEDEDEVEDVDDVNVSSLPAASGVFKMLGRVTAVNAEQKTLAVNGMTVDVSNAKIRRSSSHSLGDVEVGDRVEMSGTVADGKLLAKKVVVTGAAKAKGRLSAEESRKLKEELQGKIDDVLRKIEELKKKIQEKLGIEL